MPKHEFRNRKRHPISSTLLTAFEGCRAVKDQNCAIPIHDRGSFCRIQKFIGIRNSGPRVFVGREIPAADSTGGVSVVITKHSAQPFASLNGPVFSPTAPLGTISRLPSPW